MLVGEYAGLRARQAELAPFAALQRSVVFSFFGALAVALVISLLLARQITGPLRRLVGITREVAEGRYSGEVDIRSRDEIGELAEAFQGMLSELREKQRLVEFLGSSATSVQTPGDWDPRHGLPRPVVTSASGRCSRVATRSVSNWAPRHGRGLPGVRSGTQGTGRHQDAPRRPAWRSHVARSASSRRSDWHAGSLTRTWSALTISGNPAGSTSLPWNTSREPASMR